MRNVASLFSEEARAELEKQLGIALSDGYDYSWDELESLYEQITDRFPYEFDADGNPLRMGRIFEDIIDIFCKNKLVELN